MPYEDAYVSVKIDDREEKSIPYLLSEKDKVEVRTKVADVLTAPVSEHEEVGDVSYYLNGTLVKRYPVVTQGAVEERTYGWIFAYILRNFLP